MLQQIRRQLAPYYEKFFSFWPAGYSPFPTNVVFELLYACNLSCPFCYLRIEETVKKIKAQRHLLTKEIITIIDQIPRQTAISFTGGEPMVHKDILKILKHAKQKHRVGIISNLTVNNPRQNQQLVNLGLDTLMTSLDGHTASLHDKGRGKGSFRKTLKNLKDIQRQKKRLKQSFPTLTINSMILSHNFQYLSKMVGLAYQLKIDWLNFQLLDPSIDRSGYDLHPNLKHLKADNRKKIDQIPRQKLQSSLHQALKQAHQLKVRVSFSPQFSVADILDYYSGKTDLKRAYCNRIFHLTRISPFGDLYPCFNLEIGSLLDISFMKLWNNKKYRRFRQQIKKGALKAQCVGCCHLRLRQK